MNHSQPTNNKAEDNNAGFVFSEEFKPYVAYIPILRIGYQNIRQYFFGKKNLTKYYKPKNVLKEFNYTLADEAAVTDVNLTFVNVEQKIHCFSGRIWRLKSFWRLLN